MPLFEDLLEKVDLSGPLDADLKRTLIEFHQFRNVLAHRRGIADSYLLAACPWRTDLKLGHQFPIDPPEYDRLIQAIPMYGVELMARTARKFGLDLHPGLAADSTKE